MWWEFEFSKQDIRFACSVKFASYFVLFVSEDVGAVAHHLYALDPLENLLINSAQLLLSPLNQFDQLPDVSDTETHTKALDGQFVVFGSLFAAGEVVLDVFADGVYPVVVDVDDLMDVVGDADFEVGDDQMELLDEALVDVFAVVSHYLFYHQDHLL